MQPQQWPPQYSQQQGPWDPPHQQQQPQQPAFFVPPQAPAPPAPSAASYGGAPAGYGAPASPHPPQQYGSGGYGGGGSYGAAPLSPSYGAGAAPPSGYGMGGAPPMQPAAQGGGAAGFGSMDPFLTGVAGNMLRQQGQSYLQRGQAFMQSKMGFLSGSSLHYLFSITPEYVRSKLGMLGAPYLGRWSYVRHAEQISGGHKYLPPRQDVNAPDLYIPLMALWTYCVLLGVAALARAGPGGGFRPETIYNSVSSATSAWLGHTLLLKVILYLLGIPSAVPLLELAAYAGYPFCAACASTLVQLVLPGRAAAYHAVWAYGSLCAGVFLVRSMKRVIFQEARTYSIDSTRHNYLLLGLAILQFPLNAWLARLPSPAKAAANGAAAAAAAAAAGAVVEGAEHAARRLFM